MIQTSEAFRRAIVGKVRRTYLRAVVDISDPDKQMKAPTSSGQAPWSRPDQLNNYETELSGRYATLEDGRWLLDGSFDLFPDNYKVEDETGHVGDVLCGPDGTFPNPPWVQNNFSGVRILQACSLYFSGDPVDGVPMDFSVEVWSNSQLVYSEEVTENKETQIDIEGFTVYDPTHVRLTVKRWSLPYRRVRMTEFTIGFFERWGSDALAGFEVTHQGNFSCLTLPFGTAKLAINNISRRFEPRRKDSIFESIEERQGIDLYIGTQLLPEKGVEYVRVGMFYQSGDGWKTSDNGLAMNWSLVDIVGLVADRTYIPPASLPTTLKGWIASIVAQLGVNFANLYHVDPNYANLSVTAPSREAVTGKRCGDILRWACMATGTWPRADAETGYLTAEPLWSQGNKVLLRNLVEYPTMKANESIAALIYHLGGASDNEFVVSGNATSSETTITIENPFIRDSTAALAASRLILSTYGGNIYELTGRGDPSSEIGDVDTIWLDESNAATARRMSQTFEIRNGVLQGCRSTLLQADGSYLWEEFAVIRASGTWQAPPGVHQLRIVLGQGGQGSGPGGNGWIGMTGNLGHSMGSGYGEDGVDGVGGAIWYGVINCNEGQIFQVNLGAGGAPGTVVGQAGAMGGHTTFGVYSSENGRLYDNGYTDIANGQAFARTGVPAPSPGTGDGAKGGKGGEPGQGYIRTYTYTPSGSTAVNTGYELVVTKEPGPGGPGIRGATGFAMVTWDKPTEDEE